MAVVLASGVDVLKPAECHSLSAAAQSCLFTLLHRVSQMFSAVMIWNRFSVETFLNIRCMFVSPVVHQRLLNELMSAHVCVCLSVTDFNTGSRRLSVSDDVTVTSLAVVPVNGFLNSSTVLALCASV